MRRGGKKPSPAFMRSAARSSQSDTAVSEVILKQARKTGQLNLSNRSLEVVPSSVWRINTDPPAEYSMSFSHEDRWWDQVELTKLILAANEIKELSEEIKLLQALAVLDVHSNQLSSLPDAIGELEQLKRLVLSHNKLSSVPKSLSNLQYLQVLKVDHNGLSELPADFSHLTCLEEVDASYNRLSNLPPSLCGCASIRSLAIDNNLLCSLPEELGTMPRLKQLMVNNNKLTSLPNFGTGAMEVLNCNYNCLVNLPQFKDPCVLKELHYGHNKLSSLDPQKLTSLRCLMILDLRENSISNIPECIVELQQLERIDLANNNLTSLPFVMGNMIHMKSLVLDSNPFRGLRQDIIQRGTTEVLKYLKSRIQTSDNDPPLVHNSTKFTPTKSQGRGQSTQSTSSVGSIETELSDDKKKDVNLSRQNLTELPEKLFVVVRLTSLNVSFNKLTVIPPTIAVFTAISVLDIRNNRLKDLPTELEMCSELRDLIANNNLFSNLPPVVYSLKRLETILASNNQISTIDADGLLCLPMLSTLDLRNNSIAQVPPRLGTVTSLKHLELSGNPFRTPRTAILVKGTAGVLEYLRDRIPS